MSKTTIPPQVFRDTFHGLAGVLDGGHLEGKTKEHAEATLQALCMRGARRPEDTYYCEHHGRKVYFPAGHDCPICGRP